MAEAHEHDPILDPLPPPRPNLRPPPPVHASPQTWQELAENYGSISAFLTLVLQQHLPAIYGEMDEFRGGINHVGRLIFDMRERMPFHPNLTEGVVTILPPMRDRRPTYDEIGEHVVAKVAEELRKRASKSPGPMVEETPEALTALIREVLDTELTTRAEHEKQQRDAAELAERRRQEAVQRQEAEQRLKDRRAAIIKWVGGVAGTLATGAITWGAHVASLKAEHALGVKEGKLEAPAMIVPMPVSAPAMSAPMPPPAAPADVQPGGRR